MKPYIEPMFDFDHNHFTVSDEYRLYFSRWGEVQSPKGVFIALHGMNDYGNAFRYFGQYFAERGFLTIAYDARGFGRNDRRGEWFGAQRMIADFNEITEVAKNSFPSAKIYLIGDSMGAATLLAGVKTQAYPKVTASIYCVPAVWGWSNQNPIYTWGLKIGEKLFKNKKFTAPEFATRKIVTSNNNEMLREMGHDQNMIWQTGTSAIKGLVDIMELAYNSAPILGSNQKAFVMFAGQDHVIPLKASKKFVSRLRQNVRHRIYDEAFHMMLRDNERETYFQDIEDFITS